MSRWLQRHGLLEVGRSDSMRTPGRRATLRLGPFEFEVDTADDGGIAFAVNVGPIAFAWLIGTIV